MGPGFKYHIVTIASIFFALTIGLVVGSLYVSPNLIAGQTNLLTALKKTASEENSRLHTEIKHYKDFTEATIPLLLKDRLLGTSIAIIQVGEYPDALSKVREGLQMAGARIASITTLDRPLSRPEDLLNKDLASLHAINTLLPDNRANLMEALAGVFGQGGTTAPKLMELLEHEEYLHGETGNDYSFPVNDVVLVVGRRVELFNRVVNVDQPLILAMQKAGLTVVACEPQEAQISDIAVYNDLKLNLSTVDNVDSDIGQCALIFTFRGDIHDYGIKTVVTLRTTRTAALPPDTWS